MISIANKKTTKLVENNFQILFFVKLKVIKSELNEKDTAHTNNIIQSDNSCIIFGYVN